MRDKIHCLMTTSVALDSRMRDVLFDTACLMLKRGSSKKKFADPSIEGMITTAFEEKALGAIVGAEFHADVETDIGRGKVKFIVRPADADKRNELDWVPLFAIDDFFETSPASKKGNPLYN